MSGAAGCEGPVLTPQTGAHAQCLSTCLRAMHLISSAVEFHRQQDLSPKQTHFHKLFFCPSMPYTHPTQRFRFISDPSSPVSSLERLLWASPPTW